MQPTHKMSLDTQTDERGDDTHKKAETRVTRIPAIIIYPT